VAQMAITLSNLSGGRFLLGLGASGPQVIEGLHGVSFERPLRRLRETVEIVRRVFDGEKISYSGHEFEIPRPGGDAVPMRLSMRAEHPIPVYLATLSPAMLRLTGEIADGWLGTSFVPEGAAAAYFAYLDEGLARSGRSRGRSNAGTWGDSGAHRRHRTPRHRRWTSDGWRIGPRTTGRTARGWPPG